MIVIVLIFFIFMAVGFITLRSTVNEKRLFTLLPASIILGLSMYIFLLNLNSKIFRGLQGIIFATVEFLLIGLFLYIKYRKTFINFEPVSKTTNILYFVLVITIISFATLKMTTQLPAADSSMQWAYAASFTRGNYPIKTPWQPDLNASYHLGAYFLEGALHSLSGLKLLTVHTLMSIYLLIAGSLISVFIFWENKYSFKNLWLILASLILFISFGIIIIVYPDFTRIHPINNITDLNQLISFIPAKQEAGAPLVNLSFLGYLPARSLGLGLALLALYFSFAPFKNPKLKILFLCLILSTTAFVEESIFLPMFSVVLFTFILSLLAFIFKGGNKFFTNIDYLNQQTKTLLLVVLITSILVVLEGGFISDNIFSKKESIFRLTLPILSRSFSERFQIFNNVNLESVSPFLSWFIPSPLFFILILLTYSYFKNQPSIGLISIFSAASYILYLIVEYKYGPYASIRVYSHGNIAVGYGVILLLFSVFKNLSLRKNLIGLILFIPILVVPSLLPDLMAQYKKINEGIKDGVKKIIFSKESSSPQKQLINWANKNLPLNARIIVLDVGIPSPGNTLNFQYHGLYTTLGPQYIHVNRQEPGSEYFDLLLTLNPSSFRQTKTEYLYIESASAVYYQLPQFRKDDLENRNYFELLKSIDLQNDTSGREIFFRLYKVLPAFLDETLGGKEINEGTLETLAKLIPKEATVYIDDYGDDLKLSFWYRMAVILALKDKDIRRNLSQTDYQAIETEIPYKSGSINEEYNFYILAPNDSPSFPAKLIWSNIYAKAWQKN